MKTRTIYSPIFITGVERSGSTLMARILKECGVWTGECNAMLENVRIHALHHSLNQSQGLFPNVGLRRDWKPGVMEILQDEAGEDVPWMVKSSLLTQYWTVWNYAFPDAQWVIVRRRTGDVIESCMKTGYMRLFKNPATRKQLNLDTEQEGWLWWIHQYEKRYVEMIEHGLNCRVVWPDRMVDENYEQIQETVKWLGLKWNETIPDKMRPLLEKSRRMRYGKNND